jgi:hypothetical protein
VALANTAACGDDPTRRPRVLGHAGVSHYILMWAAIGDV